MLKEKKTFYYHELVSMWQKFCELHHQLLELTYDEYAALLESDIERVELLLQEKDKIIQNVHLCERDRSEIIKNINTDLSEQQISNIKDLLLMFKDFSLEVENQHLAKFNLLLIDIIQRIQLQNKKNQVFLNKALNSLRELREGFSGKKGVTTYNNKGNAQTRSY